MAELEEEEKENHEEEESWEGKNNLKETEKADRVDKDVHSFWWQETAYIFYVKFTDYYLARNMGAPLDKILDKNKK